MATAPCPCGEAAPSFFRRTPDAHTATRIGEGEVPPGGASAGQAEVLMIDPGPRRASAPSSDGSHQTLCPYCGVGCGLRVQIEDGAVRRVKGDPDHPSSLGDVCAKAVHLPPALRTPDRLLYPQLRARRDTGLARAPWELAVRFVADRLRPVVASPGPDAVAFYGSGPLLTGEDYLASTLAQGPPRPSHLATHP